MTDRSRQPETRRKLTLQGKVFFGTIAAAATLGVGYPGKSVNSHPNHGNGNTGGQICLLELP